jgi:HSP20 family molecular chaperone IbpA
MKLLFDELFETSYGCTNKINQSNVSIQDQGDSWVAEVILAGFSKKDISINANNDTLEVKAKSEERQSREAKLKLNGLVSIDKISSRLQDGILKIKLPKLTTANKISIRVD